MYCSPIAWNELYTSLQTGVVDGQENAVPTFLFAKLEEVQKYLVLDGHVYSISALLINEKWYQSLPAQIQETLQTAAQAAALSSRNLSIEREKEGLQMLSKSDQVTVYSPSKKEKDTFKKATQKVQYNG